MNKDDHLGNYEIISGKLSPVISSLEILDTDYKTYSIIYSETKDSDQKQTHIWVLTRAPLDKDSEEVLRIKEIAKQVLSGRINEFDFDEEM